MDYEALDPIIEKVAKLEVRVAELEDMVKARNTVVIDRNQQVTDLEAMTNVGFEILPDDGCITCQQLDEHRHMLQSIIVELEAKVVQLEANHKLGVALMESAKAHITKIETKLRYPKN